MTTHDNQTRQDAARQDAAASADGAARPDDAIGAMVVAPRFCGPPGIGNGGYVSGLVAGYLPGSAEVTLRSPAPLGRPLSVERGETGVRIRDGGTLVAEGRPAGVRLPAEIPGPVSVAVARDAGARSRLRLRPQEHPFPECFVCGWRRPDGLGIMPGPVPGRALLADAWVPAGEFAGPDGEVRPEFVWAALDCIGGFGAFARPAADGRVSGDPVLGDPVLGDPVLDGPVRGGPITDGTVPYVTSPDVPRPDTPNAVALNPEAPSAGAVGPGTATPDVAGGPVYLLGRLTVRQLGPVTAGEPYAVAGWRLEKDGRKMLAGTALFSAAGQPAGIARAVWIRLR